jgi:hypothetical protein
MNANVKAMEILNAKAINDGFLAIIDNLGIILTETGVAAIKNPSRDEIQAALNLARGNAAEKSGNQIEMLTYLYNASAYDPSLLDAADRFEVFSRLLSSGDTGELVKSDLMEREKWKKILDEFDKFYRDHPPFALSFNPVPTQKGYTDYDNRTATLEFEAAFQEDISFEAMQKVFTILSVGLKKTGNQELWGFSTRPYRSPLFGKFTSYSIKAELVHDRNEAVDELTFRIRSRIVLLRSTLYADSTQKIKQSFKPIQIDSELTGNMMVRIVSVNGMETEKVMQNGFIRVIPVEEVPKKISRNPLVILTRNISDR